MEILEFAFKSALIVLFVNFIVGLFQRYAPEVLPPILRRSVYMKTTVTLTYDNFGLPCTATITMNGSNEREAKSVIRRTLGSEKFIDIGESLIAVSTIRQVYFKEEKGE